MFNTLSNIKQHSFRIVQYTEHQPDLEWIERKKKLKATTSTSPIPEVNSSRAHSAHILPL